MTRVAWAAWDVICWAATVPTTLGLVFLTPFSLADDWLRERYSRKD